MLFGVYAGVLFKSQNFSNPRHVYNVRTPVWIQQSIFKGSLPALSWILPPLQACDHPCHDIAKGERLLKDVYEALRAGPAWNSTLLFVAYDDAGGYYDHIVPPHEGVPADESPCTVPGVHPKCGHPFDFRRLGLRTTSLLISPWVGKGAVFQEPRRGPFNSSQFELTSVPATLKNLFNLSFFLTKRDAWAGSFEELLLENPRTDAPVHLPDAPAPATPWTPPPPRSVASMQPTGPTPQHCSSWHGERETTCKGLNFANLKQQRHLRMFAEMLNVPVPDVKQMTSMEADLWLARHWPTWMAQSLDSFFGPRSGIYNQYQNEFVWLAFWLLGRCSGMAFVASQKDTDSI